MKKVWVTGSVRSYMSVSLLLPLFHSTDTPSPLAPASPRAYLGGDEDSAAEVRIGLHDDVAGGGVLPVRGVLHAQDQVVLALHLLQHQMLCLLGRLDGKLH